MFTETKSRLGWRTGASRFTMKEQLELLQSFDPAERAQAGQQLVERGLNRCAEPLLDHVANEFDNRVLAAIAAAVVPAPAESKESRKAQELRQWAVDELERSALEEAFMGGEPGAVAFPPEPDFQSAGLEPAPEPLPVRVPVAAVAPAPIEYRFEVPEPEAQPIEYRPAEQSEQPAPEPVDYRFDVPEPEAQPIEYAPSDPIEYAPADQPAPEPIEYRFEAPAPVTEYQPEAPAPVAEYQPAADVPQYISWRPPADDEIPGALPSNGHPSNGSAADNGNGHESWTDPAPALEAEVVETEAVEADAAPEPEVEGTEYGFETSEPVEYRYESPAPTAEPPANVPADSCQEYRFETPEPGATEEFHLEAPAPSEPAPEPTTGAPTNGEPKTLAERLKARDA